MINYFFTTYGFIAANILDEMFFVTIESYYSKSLHIFQHHILLHGRIYFKQFL